MDMLVQNDNVIIITINFHKTATMKNEQYNKKVLQFK